MPRDTATKGTGLTVDESQQHPHGVDSDPAEHRSYRSTDEPDRHDMPKREWNGNDGIAAYT